MSLVPLKLAKRRDAEVAQIPQQQIPFAQAFGPFEREALVGASLLSDLKAGEALGEQIERSVDLQARAFPRGVLGSFEDFEQVLGKSDGGAVLNDDAAEAELAFGQSGFRLAGDGLAQEAFEELARPSVEPLVQRLLGYAYRGEPAREESDDPQRRCGYVRRFDHGRAELCGRDLAAFSSHPAAGLGKGF